jgi:signal transduction histidine kinase
LLTGWLVVLVAPLGWWLIGWRSRLDPWRHLPVPGAVLSASGRVLARSGPGITTSWPTELPAVGTVSRAIAADGTPVALTGVRGGAVAVAVEADPGLARRHGRLAALVPLLQHELRGSLQAVLGHVALATDEPRALTTCEREVRRLIEVVDGAEVLARLSADDPARQPTSVAALLDAAVEDAAVEGHPVDVHQPDPDVQVSVVRWQLVRALRNLIDNALRYGGSPVQVVATTRDGQVRIQVRDGGPGLTSAELERLIAPFVRGDVDQPGSGLGLTIVGDVLQAHGSRLEADDGIGFRLPVHPVG